MKIQINDDEIYNNLIDLLRDVKLVHSPEGLRATLTRHPKIKRFLTDYQKREIIDIESNL